MEANKEWSVQYYLPKIHPPGKYKMIWSIRSDAEPKEGVQHTVGVYDVKQKKITASKVITAKEISGAKYRDIELGEWELNPNRYLYIGGFNQQIPGRRIFLDSISPELVR